MEKYNNQFKIKLTQDNGELVTIDVYETDDGFIFTGSDGAAGVGKHECDLDGNALNTKENLLRSIKTLFEDMEVIEDENR